MSAAIVRPISLRRSSVLAPVINVGVDPDPAQDVPFRSLRTAGCPWRSGERSEQLRGDEDRDEREPAGGAAQLLRLRAIALSALVLRSVSVGASILCQAGKQLGDGQARLSCAGSGPTACIACGPGKHAGPPPGGIRQ